MTTSDQEAVASEMISEPPSKIIFVNALTGKVTDEVEFNRVPESIRFAANARGVPEPVIKISEATVNGQRIIKQIGRNDVVLKITVQICG